ncbi:uncharacterized protein LOC116619849 isoform X3 [Nematostella vectensis]|uniref:uncharacterized protein LOC116619849 isoform X3 n=1 Tax=Nematostella vectensis TaxID=45351 RepID=UPI00207739F4|nr:uncharacterized protein LOC116619849 isoform X3 [Nematostella vectensis]
MSLHTRINGFTAWVNLRLAPTGYLMHNILTDLLKGYNMKMLLESLTGRPFDKLQSFEGLTQTQKTTRVEWIVKELKTVKIIPKDTYVDSRMFAMRAAEQVFDLLWCLVCHDIWYVWERSEFLQRETGAQLVAKPFSWTPPPPPPKTPTHKVEKDLMLGFGPRSLRRTPISTPESSPSPTTTETTSDEMVSKRRRTRNYPSPEYCILDMVNAHLRMTREGRKLTRGVMSIDDLTDSRVLCALVNSFVPETFTTEILLNDRWTINLALQTANQMFHSSNPFDSQDLVEGDVMSVCAYFAFFFMSGYKFIQSRAMLKRLDELNVLKIGVKDELEQFPELVTVMKDLKRQKELENIIVEYDQEITIIEQNYDVTKCAAWVKQVAEIQNKCRAAVSNKIVQRFDIVKVPRNVTINDLTVNMVINLSLTCGTGFYSSKANETVWKGRKLVIKDKKTGIFYDDFSGNSDGKMSVRQMLGIDEVNVEEVNATTYPDLEIFFESPSRNKTLKAGSLFLYQVFPGTTTQCQRLLFKAAKTGELDIVQKLVAFFHSDKSFVNSREHSSGNTALHMACRHGHFDIVEHLLENGAEVDSLNNQLNTPFFLATESLHKDIGQLLIEWGTDVKRRNRNSKTAFDLMRHYELKIFWEAKSQQWAELVPRLISGDLNALADVIAAHHRRETVMASLKSRCVSGSTLLHTAAFFGAIHIIKLLLEAGANIDCVDHDGNTPLHVKCYGETGEPTDLECIEKMLMKGAPLTIRNDRGLMPIHCCAMQGRVDSIQALLLFDSDGHIRRSLDMEDECSPPSLLHLAAANDHLECAEWLSSNGFEFKENETDILVHKILLEQIPCSKRVETVRFLLRQGASVNPTYSAGNTALHLSAGLSNASDVLELFISFGADVDAVNNDLCTPLFYATQANNMYAASMLIEQGANVRMRNLQGLTAFDFISDFEEWVDCGYFTEEVKARLKAYSLKHARNLVRAITKKVQGHSMATTKPQSHHALGTRPGQVPMILPPINKNASY